LEGCKTTELLLLYAHNHIDHQIYAQFFLLVITFEL
jgi:hypothetical protein